MPKRTISRQSKPRREEAKGRELSELKKENNQLKRQLARLRKQISQLEEMVSFPEQVAETAAPEKDDRPRCERCESSNVKEATLPMGILRLCKDCGYRKTRPLT